MDDTEDPGIEQPLSPDDALADAQVAATWYDLGYFDAAPAADDEAAL